MIKNILIVDDALVNIEFLEMFFLGHEADVHKAMRADDVEKLIETEVFDVSLIDYHMPGTDGATMLKNLEKKNKLSKLGRIFILTADVAFNPDKTGVAKLISGCMYKPLNVERLEALLFPDKVPG